jgi:hypothetical protein
LPDEIRAACHKKTGRRDVRPLPRCLDFAIHSNYAIIKARAMGASDRRIHD